MVLVDTSVWIDHFRNDNAQLSDLLKSGEVVTHSFVIGELACGNIKNREEIIDLMQDLPQAVKADDDEVLLFIENHQLMRRGIGYIDVHLLASAVLSGVPIWTLDKKLQGIALQLNIDYN